MSNSKIKVSNIDGNNGFKIEGIDEGDFLGRSLNNTGDVNNDGIDDFIVSAYLSPVEDRLRAGKSYVIFGQQNISQSSLAANFDLSTLDGSNGFVIDGVSEENRSGFSVSSAGDINNDGVDDLVVTSTFAEIKGKVRVGRSYIVFGSSNIAENGKLNLANLNGTNGFVIEGIDAEDNSGFSVSSAGDINDDGIDDLIIGAPNADEENELSIGESYLVFGGTDVGSSGSFQLSGLDGTNGFLIKGIAAGDNSGFSVSNAGDINNDGISDIIVGARLADVDGKSDAGKSYVIYGGSNNGSDGTIELSELDGSNGFTINGNTESADLGSSVSSAGDVNKDGVEDLIIGAPGSNHSYVVFGGNNIVSNGSINVSELDGTNGFTIEGIFPSDEFGYSVSSAGDINGDRIDDLIIGARYADVDKVTDVGQSYIIYGGYDLGKSGKFQVADLDGSNGFIFNGTSRGDNLGIAVSDAGDINGDGRDDLIIGSPGASRLTGESYVLYGFNDTKKSYIADLNGDSKAEIVQRDIVTGENTLNQTDGTKNTIPIVENTAWQIKKVVDVSGDRKADILWRNSQTGENAIWQMDGNSVISYDFLLKVEDNAWEIQDAADFNGDGKADILWRNSQTGDNAIWQMDGANVISYDFIPNLANDDWEIEAAADFNGDRKADILWRDRVTGANAIWQMDGANVISYDFIDSVDTNWEIEAAADFNGDSRADILWRNSITEENAIWQMNGATVDNYGYTNELDNNWKVAGVGDINGDSKADIYWLNYLTQENTVWYLDGTNVLSTDNIPNGLLSE